VLANWKLIGERIQAHLDRLLASQVKKEIPIPTNNPVETESLSNLLQQQQPEMKIVSSVDEAN
jgi:hypothetical protein